MPLSRSFIDRANALIMVVVALPSVVLGYYICCQCPTLSFDGIASVKRQFMEYTCNNGMNHPLFFVNGVFLANVCVLFWLISLIVKSTWLIGKRVIIMYYFDLTLSSFSTDPYWTFIPVLIGLFYHFHPLAHGDAVRTTVSLALVVIWSIRYVILISYISCHSIHFTA